MARGRKPVPSPLRKLKGIGTHHPKPQGEPKPAPGMPTTPDYLTDVALEEWHRVAGELHRIGILTIVDQTVLAAYCTVYARWREAESLIDEVIVRGGNGQKTMHPSIQVAHKCLDTMHKYMTDLGLSPAARVRLASGTPTEGDLLDQFVNTAKRKAKVA